MNLQEISTVKLQAKFVADNITNGMSFEESLEKSFDQVNEFLNSMTKSEMFLNVTFELTKTIINK